MKTRHAERGNVLFYILIAIVLLAALSFAVANSMRGNVTQLSSEQARLVATEMIEYANIISSAVAQLRLRGVPETSLCFNSPSQPAGVDYNHAGCGDSFNMLYHPDGAGVIWARPPEAAMDTSASPDYLWHFYGDNEIENVGTTCAGASCSDLLLVTDELSKEVCVQLNAMLGVGVEGDDPPTDGGLDATLFQSAFGYGNTIGDEAGGTELAGRNAACYQKTGAGARYVFFKVLLSR